MTTRAIINDVLTTIPDIAGLSIRSPLDGDYPVTQAFGVRSVTGILHRGIDQSCVTSTPVRNVRDGIVGYTYTDGRDMPGLDPDGSPGGYGNQVRVKHSGGIESRYAHLSAVHVRLGQFVEAGAVLGLSGTTGISTGPHLHWEMRLNGDPFDPSGYIGLEDDMTPEEARAIARAEVIDVLGYDPAERDGASYNTVHAADGHAPEKGRLDALEGWRQTATAILGDLAQWATWGEQPELMKRVRRFVSRLVDKNPKDHPGRWPAD